MAGHIVLGEYVACDQSETDFNNSCVFKTMNSVTYVVAALSTTIVGNCPRKGCDSNFNTQQ